MLLTADCCFHNPKFNTLSLPLYSSISNAIKAPSKLPHSRGKNGGPDELCICVKKQLYFPAFCLLSQFFVSGVLCTRFAFSSSIYLDLDHDDPTPTDPTQLHIIILQLPQIHCDIFNR